MCRHRTVTPAYFMNDHAKHFQSAYHFYCFDCRSYVSLLTGKKVEFERYCHDDLDASYFTHYFAWGNNPKRAELKGRRCRIVATGRMGSAMVEFENGQREIVSRLALRRKGA